MIENRRVRFGNLAQLDKGELELACDIWLADVVNAPWVSREAMKLAAHMIGYIRASNPAAMQVREMETSLQLKREEINRALALMKLFGVLSVFSIDKDDVCAALHLSSLQSFRMIELRTRYLAVLAEQRQARPLAVAAR